MGGIIIMNFQLGRHGWSAWRPLLLQRRLMSASSEGGGLVTCEMIETGSGLVGKVSFNSPGRLNALTVPMAEDFTHTLTKQLMESEVKNIRAVVLTGSGRAFSAGGDIDWLIDRHRQSQNRDANIKTMINFYKSFLGPLRRLPCPVTAAINGPAIGAGACLAVGGCDIRYASTKASLGFTFTKSADLLLSGRVIDSKEAL